MQGHPTSSDLQLANLGEAIRHAAAFPKSAAWWLAAQPLTSEPMNGRVLKRDPVSHFSGTSQKSPERLSHIAPQKQHLAEARCRRDAGRRGSLDVGS